MKKFLFIIAIAFSLMITANAYASTSISVKSSSSVTVGKTLSVTVTISSSEPLGSWDFVLGYDTSKLTLLDNTNQRIVGYGDGSIKSKSYTFNFRAKEVGSASIYIDSATYYNWNEKLESVTKGSKKVTITSKPTSTATNYSTNNYLSSLSIEGYELTPVFKKDVLEYSVILPEETYSIKLVGSVEDNKAKASGLGDIILTDGENKLEVKVTAENGNVKIYRINATVEEPDPVKVTIDNNEYTIVRKKDGLEIPNNYKETTVTIEGENVLAFQGEVTNYTLIALKDNIGNIFWYIYEINENKYTLYTELKFNYLDIHPFNISDDKILDGYKKDTLTIADINIDVLKKQNCYPIIYGKNLETGEIAYYEYDASENTLQKYNEQGIKDIVKEKDKYFYCTIGIGVLCIFELIIILIVVIHKNSKNSKKIEEALSKTMKIDNI
ncbi:MAG: hypothetical protein NC181_05600 [Clostridium sp.]|nr:hypothetical protein [Clostridium sp.]MCM1444716.1 hypothetical protein [Candidatus Amulumruptor caecigallinarius]